MKKLLVALAAFGQDPEAVGDDLFKTFGAITSMSWEEATAAGTTIYAMMAEVSRTLPEGSRPDKDPKFSRLQSCLSAVVVRVGQLVAKAPKNQQAMLVESVTLHHDTGFVPIVVTGGWKRALGLLGRS